MTLGTELQTQVAEIFAQAWDEQTTYGVPDPTQIRLNNHAKDLQIATVLYADLDGSTNMVDNYQWWFSAEVYKAYLRCAARIIASEGGTVTAYDGDRIMAIFTGDSQCDNAVRAALKINYAVEEIIRPAIKKRYPTTEFLLKHVIGIDRSQLRAARIGVRGYNDLVWVGKAANHAAKLTNLSEKPLWITKSIFDGLGNFCKFSNNQSMWDSRYWTAMNNALIYCSTYRLSM
ncbi:adenylate/guanylate cyclase domain-containing protein [Paraburkholderia caribensis]|uniref:adenylate/guanylate cyclase domain-containing protein n=1 Tax=Paraburkholderia caribensis TaxID=75105 RepID=UPI00209026E6|nr:adenylate/guanylate cyclase domain-containing protein [Paraburkholderia caribensis]MCO4879027.1 adenylate/guanylate cyclase domain-containing protein [Paraburkholderia caribensis]